MLGKYLVVFVLFLFLFGCSADIPDEPLVKEPKVGIVPEEPVIEIEPEPVVEDEGIVIEEEVEDMFLKPGESLMFSGKKVKLIDVALAHGGLTAVVSVDGVSGEIKSVNEGVLINGVIVDLGDFDSPNNNIELKLELLKLGESEFFLDTANQVPVEVLGEEVKLRDVLSNDRIWIDVPSLNIIRLEIKDGQTRTSRGLTITNVKSFYDPEADKRHAIVKFEKL